MDAYVKVGNDLQVAVRNIILSKKAFLKQSRCINVLIKQNDLLQQKIKRVEMNNKELRALSLLTKQHLNLKKQVSERAMSELEKREHVLDEILASDTTFKTSFVLSEGTTSQEESAASSDVNSTEDDEEVVPGPESPTKRKRIQNKDNVTPLVTKKRDKRKNVSQTAVSDVNSTEDKDIDDTSSVTKNKDTQKNVLVSRRRSSRNKK